MMTAWSSLRHSSSARDRLAATDALADDIKHFVKNQIALYKYPRWIEFVTSLPKNDRGKIDRKLLKQHRSVPDA